MVQCGGHGARHNGRGDYVAARDGLWCAAYTGANSRAGVIGPECVVQHARSLHCAVRDLQGLCQTGLDNLCDWYISAISYVHLSFRDWGVIFILTVGMNQPGNGKGTRHEYR